MKSQFAAVGGLFTALVACAFGASTSNADPLFVPGSTFQVQASNSPELVYQHSNLGSGNDIA